MGDSDWPLSVTVREFYKIYIRWCDDMKINHRESEFWLARRLNEKGGAFLVRRGAGGSKFYDLPSLSSARNALEDKLGYSIKWDE